MEHQDELAEKMIEYLEIEDLLHGYDITRENKYYKVRDDGVVETLLINYLSVQAGVTNKNNGWSNGQTFEYCIYMNDYFDDDRGKMVSIVSAQAEIKDGNIQFWATNTGACKRFYTTDVEHGGLFDKQKFLYMLRSFYKVWA